MSGASGRRRLNGVAGIRHGRYKEGWTFRRLGGIPVGNTAVTLIYYDDRFLDHDTGTHPERAERLRFTVRHLQETRTWGRCRLGELKPATVEQVQRVHAPAYVDSVRAFCAAGGGHIDVDTVVGPASYEIALLAAGTGISAVDAIVGRGEDRTAACLVRPPGHHATTRYAMGFCLLNNIAVAARHAVEAHGLERVLIVDWDVHHGNGTQETFYTDPRVAMLSIHRFPFYPGTGGADETGEGDSAGLTCNLPVAFGTPRGVILDLFRRHLVELADRFQPQLVLQSAGYDGHRDDPIASLGLETEDFGILTDLVLDVADRYAEGRTISFLEGGYDLVALATSIQLHLERMLARG